MTNNTENKNTQADEQSSSETAQLLETAKIKLQDAQEKLAELTKGIQNSYQQNKESAPEGTSELKVVIDTIVEKAAEGAAAAKVAYDKAGGFDGISHDLADKAGVAAATIHSTYDKVSSSEITQKTVEAVKSADITQKAVSAAKSLAEKFQESYNSHYNS